MLRKRTWGAGLLTVALTASLMGTAGVASAAPAQESPAAPVASARGATAKHTVTLLTGDRVTITGTSAVAIQRASGRQDITFLTRRVDGHVHVVPSDALPLLRAGRLDPRLFDVTTLLEFGYHDNRGNVPLIVTTNPAARAARSTVTTEGVTVVRDLPVIDGMAVHATADGLAALWQRLTGTTGARTLAGGVTTVWLDGLRKPSLDTSVPQIGAPTAWQAGLDGAGVKVAVLDTGIDKNHPDLSGQVAVSANFTEGEEDDKDRVGHGTHVASTIAGTGKASGGKYTGVAPKAKLLDGKVCVDGGCAESWIVAGMEWAAKQGADVVNMSLGGWDTPAVDPLEQAVNDLTAEHGTLFVIAAGNDGADASISSPASADAALAVGAVTKTEELADFSSRGPREDGGLKPEITGPGVDIVAANSADGFLGEPGESYTTLSGTSMATPHVAGAAAILAQRHPDLAADGLKALLMGSAKPNPELGVFAQGAGRVDVAKAITQEVAVSPPGVGFGRQRWPHADDTPVVRTITYRNSGDKPVTLNLTVNGTGPAGQPAPAGLFTLSAPSVTVPAGGAASVTMTADTRVKGPDGYYTGTLTATGGGASVTTPFAVDREVESYDVKLSHLDRDGADAPFFISSFLGVDSARWKDAWGEESNVTVRLPKGTYALMSLVATREGEDDEDAETAFMVHPKVSVTKDQSLVLDSRLAKPLSIKVPRADASAVSVDVMAEVVGDEFSGGFGVGNSTLERFYTAQLGANRSYPWMRTTVSSLMARPDAEGTPVDSPFMYNLSWLVKGRMITGFNKQVQQRQLATVRAAHARQGLPGGIKFTFPIHPEVGWAFASGWWQELPFSRAEYFNTEGGVTWQSILDEVVFGEEDITYAGTLYGPTLRYKAGRVYTEQWNGGVFGPSLADPVYPEEYLTRTGDRMIVVVPTHSDGEHRAGYSAYESARLAVFRNGTKVGELSDPAGEVEVPAATGRYRVESEIVRGAPSRLSTKVNTTWTFVSGHVRGEDPKRLPVSVVRFSPRLSQLNTAAAGRGFTIPVTVQRQPGSAAARCVALTVQVSYDDGRTWKAARVITVGGRTQVQLRHPDKAGFVSLRAYAKDAAGNTVRQTIIRAYEIVK